MPGRLSERAQAILFAAVLAGSIAGVYGLAQTFQAPTVAGRGPLEASLVVEGDDWVIEYSNDATSNNTAFGLLLEAADRQGFEVRWKTYVIPSGVLVTAINGTVNGDRNRWWQYWINDAYGRVAADRQAIVDGDIVHWRFLASQEAS